SPRDLCSAVAATSTHQPVTVPSGAVIATATSPKPSRRARSTGPGGWERPAPRAAGAPPARAASSFRPTGPVGAGGGSGDGSPGSPDSPIGPRPSALSRLSSPVPPPPHAAEAPTTVVTASATTTRATRVRQRWPRRAATASGGRRAVEGEALGGFGGQVVALVVRGEAPGPHVLGEGPQRLDREGPDLGVPADERGGHALLPAHQVVVDEDLAVAVGARTDPDRRHVDSLGDHAGDLVGHPLEHDAEAARGGERLRV